MTVWLSEMNSIDTDDGVKSGVKVAIREGTTDSNGEISFDLSDLEIEEIIDYGFKGLDAVTDILDAVNVTLETISETLITAIAFLAVSATPVLGVLYSPFARCDAGKVVRLTIYYI